MNNKLSEAIKTINKAVMLCGSAATLAMLAGSVNAQDQIEEVVVEGVRAAQQSAVSTKRDAVSVVDAISAEDIGKLPDVTISDSLQRIPGVQVERTAGEGGPIQIRGFKNVGAGLNGETFINATTIDDAAADFGDLPSQLFSGADVYKSPLASLAPLGITGTVNLKTRRPFDMKDGWTFAGTAEVDQGSFTKEEDPTLTGLVNWKNDQVGFLLAGVTAKKNLATDFNGYFDTSENGGIGAARGARNVASGIYHIVPQGFSAFHKEEEREREGLNSSFQIDLNNGFELIADYFYSNQDRWNRRAGIAQNNRWQTFGNYAFPTAWGNDSFQVPANRSSSKTLENWRTVTAFDAKTYRLQSFSQNNYTAEKSQNYNIELNYDNEGPLTGQLRATHANATANMRHGYTEGDALSIDKGSLVTGPGGLIAAADCNPARGDIVAGANGGCFAAYAPNGIQSQFNIGYDVSGEHPGFSGFDQIVTGGKGSRSVAAYLADIDTYHVGAFSSEGNTDDKVILDTISTKWNYAFEDVPFITSVDFGVRDSDRKVDHTQFSYFAKFPQTGCAAQWKAVDQFAGTRECDPNLRQGEYVTGADQAGRVYNNEFVNYTLVKPMRIDQYNNVTWVDDYGGVKGLPGVWVADPKDFDDTLAFQEKVFGPQNKVIDAGRSYSVQLEELSYFFQANFEAGPVSGNVGAKVIETDLTIRQNITRDAIPHSGANEDVGDITIKRAYKDVLPAVNLTYSVTEDIKIRAGYGETMQPLPLLQWGGGKSIGRVFTNSCNCMRISTGNFAGNAELDPTEATNYDLSAEWYLGDASMVSLGLFKVEVDRFVKSTTTTVTDELDEDGVNRGPFIFTSIGQGTGGEVRGVELGGKFAFGDVTDAAFLANTGFDLNYTLSDSSQDETGINGKELPFPQNSKHTYNAVIWYENEVISARLAYNFRSERLMTQGSSLTGLQGLYQDDYGQLDVNITYDINDQWSVYLNGSNVLEEYQQAYLEYKDQKAFQNLYEARWALGARVTF